MSVGGHRIKSCISVKCVSFVGKGKSGEDVWLIEVVRLLMTGDSYEISVKKWAYKIVRLILRAC